MTDPSLDAVPVAEWPLHLREMLGEAFSIVLAADTGPGTDAAGVEVGVVATEDGVFVRASNGPTSHWFRATRVLGRGTITVAGRTLPVRFTHPGPVDHPAVHDAVDAAFATKYRGLTAGIDSARARAATVRISPPPPSYL
ncbi:DUF2255 family protein [uncultured Amnibacterium sp.]|uniref:DUF2255 family protein n=1 Tax=uncultured Amnibacterium sp. TaxID=1631851 RepID=UPI0035C972D4